MHNRVDLCRPPRLRTWWCAGIASKGLKPLGLWYWNSHWADECFWSPSTCTIDEAVLSVCIYIYIYNYHIFNVCIHLTEILSAMFAHAWKGLELSHYSCNGEALSNLLHPHQWLQAYFDFGYLLFCLVNVWFVVVSGPYLSQWTPGVVIPSESDPRKPLQLEDRNPPPHPEITSLCYGHLWFVRASAGGPGTALQKKSPLSHEKKTKKTHLVGWVIFIGGELYYSNYMGVSKKKRGTPKWMVYNGKPY